MVGLFQLIPKLIGSTTYNISRDLVGLDQTSFFNAKIINERNRSKCVNITLVFTRAYAGAPVFTQSYTSYKNDIFKAIDTLDMVLFLRSLETCDVNEVDGKSGNTPLHAACAQSANENFAINLVYDPRVNATIKNVDGNTPLHIFAKQFNNINFERILEGLVKKGAGVNEKNNQGETALHRAVFNKTIRNTLIKKLLGYGADINAVTNDNMTALHYAVQVKKVDTVMHLIGCGINWSIQNSAGQNVMDMATEQNDKLIIQALQDCATLAFYLHELGLWNYKEAFIEKRLFKYSLKTVPMYLLKELGITDPATLAKCMKSFREITDPDMTHVYLSLADTSVEEASSSVHTIKESEIQLISQLGEGSYAKVYQGIYDDKDVAVKVINVPPGAQGQEIFASKVEEARKEYEISCVVISPNTLRVYGWVDKVGPTSAPGIVMELCENKSLYDYLKSDATITLAQALKMFKEIAIGLNAIHSHVPQIIHRDLKSLNILVTNDVHMKLCDFGLARLFSMGFQETFKKARGTFRYMAPEVLGTRPTITAKSDIFALGIVYWEIIYRAINKEYQLPYDEYNVRGDNAIIELVRDRNKRPTLPVTTPPQIVNNNVL